MKLRNSVYIIAFVLASGMLTPDRHAAAQLRLPGGLDDLPRTPVIDVDRRVRERVDETVEPAGQLAEDIEDTGEQLADTVTDLADEVVDTATELLRNFAGGIDPDGWMIEEEVIVVLIDSDAADSLVQSATEVISRRDLPALGQSLLILRRTINLPLPDTIEILRDANPGATVDYNHLYFQATDVAAQPDSSGAPAPALPAAGDGPRVGIVDSAVMREHAALRDVFIEDRDFAVHGGHKPTTHGTAVASLVARSSDNTAAIYSASVFFQVPNHAPGATAESLVAALDWLVAEQVDVINMSLAGPGNQVLEAAVAALVARDVTIVAAVGNNGPSADALYPAAYDGVVGVTAVDDRRRVFRYANRGDYVDYAAYGVNVKVADSTTGGWRIESGTSMASPHVAVVIAELRQESAVKPDAVMSWLTASAEDLGRKGFDKTFGHGLITRPPAVMADN